MPTPAEALTAALTDAAGQPLPVTKIELEVLGTQFRWTLWSESKRLYSVTAKPDQVPGCLRTTQVLLESNLNLPPQTTGERFDGTPR